MNESFLRDIVILYSPPKVGSTSIVTSIRLFASDKYIVFHTHDDKICELYQDRLNVINVSDIINNNFLFNQQFNRNRKIYIIDIYRTPIERKISDFFQKISEIHFNNSEKEISKYPVEKLFKRFNDIYPYFDDTDYFNEIYNIDIDFKIKQFDVSKKYMLYEKNNIIYIKLRLNDTHEWGNILSSILNTKISIIHDYNTVNKDIGSIYKLFKNTYQLPINFFNELINDKGLNIYLSEEEKQKYLHTWSQKLTLQYKPFDKLSYDIYKLISNENKFYEANTANIHYGDEGCLCNKCCNERAIIVNEINNSKDYNKSIYIRHPFDDNYNNKITLTFLIQNIDTSTEIYSTTINLVNLS